MNEKTERALERGEVLKIKTAIGDVKIGKGPISLRSWLDSGPHGEVAQDSMETFYGDMDEYDGY